MLIFKLRGMHFEGKGAQKSAAPRVAERAAQKSANPPGYSTQSANAAQPQVTVTQPKITSAKGEEEQKEEKIASAQQFSAKVMQETEAKVQAAQPQAPSKPQKKQYEEEEKRIVEEFISRQKMEEAETQSEIAGVQKPKKRLTKTEKESMDSAKDLMCVNHPWRPAYAICDYCKRPFCYADLVEYNGKFYCLEDIDKVTKNFEVSAEAEMNPFIIASGAAFIVNALILAYFVYPQVAYFSEQAAKIGLANFIYTINYSYMLSVLNLIAVLLGIAAGALLFLKLSKNIYSIFMGVAMLIISSYIYLISNALYLLAVTIIAAVAVGMLAYGRIPASAGATEEELKPTEIEWPRLETF